MNSSIPFTMISDYAYCPLSIFCHGLYDGVDQTVFMGERQTRGGIAHKRIESGEASSPDVLCSISVASTEVGVHGRIDKYYPAKRGLVESKLRVSEVHDGHIFQMYAQYFAMEECGYPIGSMSLYSIENHTVYDLALPCENPEKRDLFFKTLEEMRNVSPAMLRPRSLKRCNACVYFPLCEWGE